MKDLLTALAFLSMIVAPCLVALRTGAHHEEEEDAR